MIIGLMGCEFKSPNKGCEALTYSLISVLSELIDKKEINVIYNFSDTSLGEVPKLFSGFEFITVKPKIKQFPNVFIAKLKECDIVLDATMGDSFSDIYSFKYFKTLAIQKKIAALFAKKYILLPQTYGPFYHKTSQMLAKGILKKAAKVYSRDQLSIDAINQLGVRDVELVSDMAFLLPYDKKMYKLNSKKTKVGINVSGLLYKGGFNTNNQFGLKMNYRKYINSLIDYCLNTLGHKVYLIPHVIDQSNNAHDDDYKICEELAKKYKGCVLAPIFNTPIEAKSYIANMDVFIGARMHSTIAAFSTGVATIPVAYSRKFKGLYDNIGYNVLIDGRLEDETDALEHTKDYLSSLESIRTKQVKTYKSIANNNQKFIKSLSSIINNRSK